MHISLINVRHATHDTPILYCNISILLSYICTAIDKQLPATLHQQSNVSGHFIGSNPPNSVGNPLLPYDAGYPLPGMHGSSSSSPPPGHTRNSSGSYSSSRRGSGDFSGSDVSGSVPSSASASSTHLPLPGATLGFGNVSKLPLLHLSFFFTSGVVPHICAFSPC